MGVVYRATQLSLERVVAVKAIAPELASNPDFRERFKRESRIAASIEHPNVIPVHEAGESEGLLYLIMRYVEGTDLRALISAQAPLDADRAAKIAGQVAAGLAAAHRGGLLHRDVKPANVLIDPNEGQEHAYLTDFGIARDVAATTGITRTGTVVGTPDYLAPERVQEGGGDARSDVYALGCVLYEALTGRVPYPRDTQLSTLYAHLNDPVPSARELRPDVPGGLDELVRRTMAKDPDQRIGSAAELAEELLGRSGALLPAPTDADDIAPTVTSARRATPATARLSKRPRAKVLAGVAIALVGAVVLAAVLRSGGGGGGAGQPGGAIKVGRQPDGVAADESGVWVANSGDDSVTRIDPRTRQPGRTIPVGGNPNSVSIGLGGVWVTLTNKMQVVQIDPSSEKRKGALGAAERPKGVAVGEGKVWVANSGHGSVGVLDPVDGGPATEVGGQPTGVAVGGGFVWITDPARNAVARLDASSGRRTGGRIRVGSKPLGVTVGAGSVWVANSGDDTVSRLSLAGKPIGRPIKVGGGPSEVAFGEDAVWVTNRNDGTLTRIDPQTGKVSGDPIEVGSEPVGVAVGHGLVWVANFGSDTVTPVTR